MKTMKKYLFLAAAVTMMASCSDNNFVGDNNPNSPDGSGAIAFGSGFKAVTRGNAYGADAAALLNNRFVVGGFKTADGSNYNKVFDNYGVEWTANTAGKTASNTSDWEYVNATKSPVTSITTEQTVKYWDYSTSSYNFIAYSTGAATEVSGEPTAGQVKVTAIDHANKGMAAFTLTGASNDLAGCYIADLVTVNKANYGKEVQLTFHSIASKVRIGLYETIPGYSVTNVKFYQAHPTTLGTGSGTTPYLIGSFTNADYFVVSYTGTTAQVTPSGSTSANNVSLGSFPSTAIGTTSAATTFAGTTSPYYQTMMPNAGTGALELAVDYTLESEDGSGEIINVYGATARIPAAYTKWLPNYAYTYIFKISDNTNGWTSTATTDPAGLYPITFDAVVFSPEEAKEQSTITTVSTPCITTYQKGHVYTAGPEYAASNDNPIFVQVMVDGNLKGDLGTKGQLYTLSVATSEAEVLNALSIQTASDATTITGRNGLVLTKTESDATIVAIPGVDGNDITVTAGQAASFAATAGNYAYVYDTGEWDGVAVALTTQPTGWPTGYYTNKACTTAATTFSAGTFYKKESYIYSAETLGDSAPTDWTTEGLWYKDPNGETAAGAWDEANNGKVFYKRYTVDHKNYGVKVIKVQ